LLEQYKNSVLKGWKNEMYKKVDNFGSGSDGLAGVDSCTVL